MKKIIWWLAVLLLSGCMAMHAGMGQGVDHQSEGSSHRD